MIDLTGTVGAELASLLEDLPKVGGWLHDGVAVVAPRPAADEAKVTAFPMSRVVRLPAPASPAVEAHAVALLRGQVLRLLAEVDAGRVSQLGCVFSRPDGLWEEGFVIRSDGAPSMIGAMVIAVQRLSASVPYATQPAPPAA